MENIKLLVFDIDGTLIDRSKDTIEESAKRAILKAKDLGYELLVATGRSSFLIHEDVKESIKPDYFVTVNGACLTDGDYNTIEAKGFSVEGIEKLIDYCVTNNFEMGVKYEDFIGVYGDYDSFRDKYMGKNNPNEKFLIHDTEQKLYETHTPLGVFYFTEDKSIEKISKEIPEMKFMPSDRPAIEVVRQDLDKKETIEIVLNKLNLSWDNVISFGDGFNDIDMLEAAKIGVAMGNASDAVKERADYVADHLLNDGIEKAFIDLKII